MINTVISYPISAYQNPPIEPQYFKPSRFVISAITLGVNTTITMTTNHNYVIGQLVRILIPNGYGSRKLNNQTGNVIAIPSANQVILDTFSIGVDAFISANLSQLPQILAIGDENSGIISTTGRVLTVPVTIPGAFTNISPQ